MSEKMWIAFGLVGQLVFTGRFVVQWLSSEREKKSVVPVAFWYLSIAGGMTLLIYAVHRADPVFMLGQGLGLFVYVRNLQLIHRNAAESAPRLKIHDASAEDSVSSRDTHSQRKAA
ncbi:MAG: lipid-A-disaccharide synthase N-terminal domain-containing protein [Planctomycetia bacterium]